MINSASLYKIILSLLIIFLNSQDSYAQKEIAGRWDGLYLESSPVLGTPKLVLEIFDFKDSLFTGITHLFYEGNQYEHYRVAGKYIKRDSLLVFIESSTIAVNLGIFGNCLGTYMMKLKKEAGYLILDGLWTPNNRGCTNNSRVWLKKTIPEIKSSPRPVARKRVPGEPPVIRKPVPSDIPAKREKATARETTAPQVLRDLPVLKSRQVMPAVITKRETDVQSLLEIDFADKDSIKVDVYDNAEIDGDSVSVYENDRQRIMKKGISAKPITFYVSLNKITNPIVHLRLIAESLGSIPPCTALMIVTTRHKRHEVHLSSNFSKNATVELFLKE